MGRRAEKSPATEAFIHGALLDAAVVDEPLIDFTDLPNEPIDPAALARATRVGVSLDRVEQAADDFLDKPRVPEATLMIDDEDHARCDEPGIIEGPGRVDATCMVALRPVPVIETASRPDHRIGSMFVPGSLVEAPIHERATPGLLLSRKAERNSGPVQILVHLAPAVRILRLLPDGELRYGAREDSLQQGRGRCRPCWNHVVAEKRGPCDWADLTVLLERPPRGVHVSRLKQLDGRLGLRAEDIAIIDGAARPCEQLPVKRGDDGSVRLSDLEYASGI
jgi:hypothetical protein